MLPRRAVDLVGVAEGDAAFALEPVERRCVGLVIAVMVGDRERDRPRPPHSAQVNRLWLFSTLSGDRAADEAEPGVAHQRAGQQPGLGQHLEAVADADHRHAASRRVARPRA